MPAKRASRAETQAAANIDKTKRTSRKRESSPEMAPSSKRTKQNVNHVADASNLESTTHVNGKAAPKSAPKKRATATKVEEVEEGIPKKTTARRGPGRPKNTDKRGAAPRARQQPPFLNPLPTAPEHTRPANQIFVWGAGNFGQFGMGPDHLGEFDKPKKNIWVESKMQEGVFGGVDAGIEAVAAGGLYTMFIDEKGTVWTCGVNDDAALGRITKDVPNPDKEGEFLDVDVLTSFPHPLKTLEDDNFRAVRIAAGDSVGAALSSEGELRVWGSFRGNEGALGFSNGSQYQFVPSPILQLPTKDGEKVASVAAGNNHLVVLTTSGNIYTWGAGEQGQLGRKVIERRKIHGTTPEKVTLHTRARKAVVAGAGNYTSFAVDRDGTVWGWGLNNMGQTGTGFSESDSDSVVSQPAEVVGLSREDLGCATVVQIAGGEHHTLFLTSDGRVYACGRSNGGQLGLSDDDPAIKNSGIEGMVARPTMIRFPEPEGAEPDPIIHISAGIHNNMAVSHAGALFAWGEGNQGELGIGDETESKTPRMIVRREGGAWKAISSACGGQHSIGLFKKKTAP